MLSFSLKHKIHTWLRPQRLCILSSRMQMKEGTGTVIMEEHKYLTESVSSVTIGEKNSGNKKLVSKLLPASISHKSSKLTFHNIPITGATAQGLITSCFENCDGFLIGSVALGCSLYSLSCIPPSLWGFDRQTPAFCRPSSNPPLCSVMGLCSRRALRSGCCLLPGCTCACMSFAACPVLQAEPSVVPYSCQAVSIPPQLTWPHLLPGNAGPAPALAPVKLLS